MPDEITASDNLTQTKRNRSILDDHIFALEPWDLEFVDPKRVRQHLEERCGTVEGETERVQSIIKQSQAYRHQVTEVLEKRHPGNKGADLINAIIDTASVTDWWEFEVIAALAKFETELSTTKLGQPAKTELSHSDISLDFSIAFSDPEKHKAFFDGLKVSVGSTTFLEYYNLVDDVEYDLPEDEAGEEAVPVSDGI